jgi:deazaflavin-dependent oxidoreductase (nitroreductase family)
MASIWFTSHLVNPVVRWLLCSPLHRVLSRSVLLLTVQGRRSGRAFTFPVQYVRDGDIIHVVPGMAGRKTWWRNLRGGGPVWLRIRNQDVQGTGEVLEGKDQPEAVAAGLTRYLQRFPQAARMYHVRMEPQGRPNPDDIRAASANAIIVRIRRQGP